jgi:cytosine deaminase
VVDGLVIRNVRPWAHRPGEPAVDVVCVGDRIEAVGTDPAIPEVDRLVEIDGAGGVALPGLTDSHTHLDSTRLGLPFRPHTGGDTLADLIANDRRNWRDAGAAVGDRAALTAGRMVAYGVTRIRSHAQIDTECKLERLEGVLAARELHRDRVDIEIVAFPQSGILRDAGTAGLMAAALGAGADLVGGLDPAGIDRDPVRHLDQVFGLADRFQRGIDIHLHDRGELGAFQIELICDRVEANGMQGLVTISHCFALATVDPERQRDLAARLAVADVAVVTVAPGPVPPLPFDILDEAGVRLGLGQDGIRGYWSPYGNGDLLERAWQMAYRSGFRHDGLIERCVEVATSGGASVMGILDHRLEPGGRADLFVVPGDTVTAAVMDRPRRRLVVKRGAVVAVDGELC